jgi:hypothetical protein
MPFPRTGDSFRTSMIDGCRLRCLCYYDLFRETGTTDHAGNTQAWHKHLGKAGLERACCGA